MKEIKPLKIRVEHLKNREDCINSSSNCKIFDVETGKQIGGVQKLEIVYDAKELLPKVKLELCDISYLSKELEVNEIKILNAGPEFKLINEMTKDELKESLHFECNIKYFQKLEIKELKEKIIDLEKEISYLRKIAH